MVLLVFVAAAALAFHAVKRSKSTAGPETPIVGFQDPKSSTLLTPDFLSDLEPRKRLLLGIPVNLNNITAEELRLIPGVSTTLADRIIDYRHQCGPFEDWSELDNVHGLGPRTLENLRPYLKLHPTPQIPSPTK